MILVLVAVSASCDENIVVTPTPAFSSYLAPSVQLDVLKPDLEHADESPSTFDWANSSIALLLDRNPESLVEKRLDDDLGFTVVHVAAAAGCTGFLNYFLNTEDDYYEIKLRNLTACLATDKEGHTPLFHAIRSESGLCVDHILGCLESAFHPEFSHKPSPDEHNVHMADLLPMPEILLALQKFPFITLKFIQKLRTFEAYEGIVRVGCEKVNIEEDRSVVLGSTARVPIRFWQRQFYPLEIEEDIKEGLSAKEIEKQVGRNTKRRIEIRSRKETMNMRSPTQEESGGVTHKDSSIAR